MNLHTISRIFLKIVLSWFIIIWIIFFPIKEVNLEKQIKTDRIISHNKITKITNKKENNILQKKEKKIPKISNFEKKVFLIKLVKSALENRHTSPINQNKLIKLCNYYKKYCDIIDIDKTEFNYKDRLYYKSITIFLLDYLNSIFHNIDKKIYYIKLQKEKLWRRWYAWHHSIVMNIKKNMDYKQFMEVLTHELWHIVDLWIITWKKRIKNKIYTEFWRASFSIDDKSINFYKLSWKSEKIKQDYSYAKDFVSWYGLTDTFEDFAECFNMYVNHNSVFKKIAKESNILYKKYMFLNNILKWKYISSDKKFNYKKWFRPRDSTKFSN